MPGWLTRLDRREQLSLLVLGLVLLAWLAWQLLWSPIAGLRERMAAQNAAAAAALIRVDALAAELVQLRTAGVVPGRQQNLAAIVNDSTAAYGLPVSRLQPGSRGDLQVRLENARFAELVAWLHRLEQGEGLLLEEIAITQAGAAGLVNATVRIGQGS